MSEQTPEVSTITISTTDTAVGPSVGNGHPATAQAPAAAAPEPEATPPAKRSLEDLLGSLDDDARSVVLGEVSKARTEAKNLRDRLKEAEPIVSEWKKLEEASKTETERANDAAAAAQQRVTQLTNRAVQAEVKALAANTFADPSDATAFIDPAKYVNDDGEIDTAAIETDLADLLTRKPHLGKTSDGPRPPAPNAAQGSSSTGPAAPAQLSQEDVDRMFAAKQYDAIEKARSEGRLDQLLGA